MSYLFEFKIVGINKSSESIQEIYVIDSIDKKEKITDILNIDISNIQDKERRYTILKYTGPRKLTRNITIKDDNFDILNSSIKEYFIRENLSNIMRILDPSVIKFDDNNLIWKLIITKTIDQQIEG